MNTQTGEIIELPADAPIPEDHVPVEQGFAEALRRRQSQLNTVAQHSKAGERLRRLKQLARLTIADIRRSSEAPEEKARLIAAGHEFIAQLAKLDEGRKRGAFSLNPKLDQV